MVTGKYGEYYWVEDKNGSLQELIENCPDIVLNKPLVNTSFDSGSLTLSVTDVEKGWIKIDSTTLIPCLTQIDAFPSDAFDEWYIFTSPEKFNKDSSFVSCLEFGLDADVDKLPNQYEIFVNMTDFSLYEPSYDVFRVRFWKQVEEIRPESYLAENYNLIFVTRNQEIFERAKLFLMGFDE